MPLNAVIFDMDGVLSDTQKLHALAQSKLLSRHGVDMEPRELTAKYAGTEPGTFLRQETDLENPMEEYSKKRDTLQKLIEERGVEPIDGARDLVRQLEDTGYIIGVASAAEPEYIDKVLKSLELKKYFSVIKSAKKVGHAKPAPDVFLETATELGAKPVNSMVIEDGRSGMEAAKRADMVSIGLVDETGDYPADETVQTLEELNSRKLVELYDRNR